MFVNYNQLLPVQKAALTLDYLASNGGALPEQVAQQFLIVMINQSSFLQLVTSVQMQSTTYRVPTMEFGSRALHKRTRGQALPDAKRTTPVTAGPTITAFDYGAEITFQKEILQSGVEQKRLQNTIMQRITDRVKEDWVEIDINSNTGSADDDLDNYDGAYVAVTTNTVTASSGRLVPAQCKALLKTLPKQFRKKAQILGVTSVNAVVDLQDALGDRPTAVGDDAKTNEFNTRVHGVRYVGDPEFPENLGAGTDESIAVLANWKNRHVGFHQRIELDWDRDTRAQNIYAVVTLRAGGVWAVEKATAKLTDILSD